MEDPPGAHLCSWMHQRHGLPRPPGVSLPFWTSERCFFQWKPTPRMGERGIPVTHRKEPSLLATLYSERSVSSPGSRTLPAWPQSQRRLRDARKGRAG